MKRIAIFVVISALGQAAAYAEAPDCKSITKPDARLACYDKSATPIAASSAAAKPAREAAAVAKAGNGKYVDTIGAEDPLMDARLKNICRGC